MLFDLIEQHKQLVHIGTEQTAAGGEPHVNTIKNGYIQIKYVKLTINVLCYLFVFKFPFVGRLATCYPTAQRVTNTLPAKSGSG